MPADEVPDLIPDHGTYRDAQQKPGEIQMPSGGKDPGRNQKRVPGKKEADEQAGLDENDDADQECSAPTD